MTTADSTVTTPYRQVLRRLYFARFGFAVVWALLLFATDSATGPGLTTLLIGYPLVDAAAVLWQLRAPGRESGPRAAEWANVVVSVLVAVAMAWAPTVSIATVLGVWGTWAVVAGIPQLIAAVARRRSGGQVPQMLSGGISVLAGASFLFQATQGAEDLGNVAGYAVVGGVFFLISALRLGAVMKRG